MRHTRVGCGISQVQVETQPRTDPRRRPGRHRLALSNTCLTGADTFRWLMHCHNVYHQKAGMHSVVSYVR